MGNSNIIIVYRCGSTTPEKHSIHDFLKDVREICNGFESSSMHPFMSDAHFICADDFSKLPSTQQSVNLIGTLLYGTGYFILGNICIVKCTNYDCSIDLQGFTESEANHVIERIEALLKLHVVSHSI